MQWLFLILLIPYLLLFLKIYFFLSKIKQFKTTNKCRIRLSVIIACRNEEGNIASLLNDIKRQNYPGELFEVIVVDDNSEDDTFNIVTQYQGIRNLKALRNRGYGKKMAITTGTENTSAELIITTDADCRAGEGWISTIASFYDQHRPDLIIGPVMLEGSNGVAGRFQELEFLSLQGVTAGTAAGTISTMCNGANLGFTAKTFRRHSENLHYDLVSGDDIFLLHSIKKEKGSKILWLESPDAIIKTSGSPTLYSLLNQRSRWISKSKAYTDRSTIVLTIVTFVTILTQMILLAAGFIDPVFFLIFLTALVMKSVPDYLILDNTTKRYGKKSLLRWFIPSQIIYPFYVFAVILFTLVKALAGQVNSPFPKGT